MEFLQETKLSERFEAAFNRIHAQLKKIANVTHTDAFTSLVHITSKKHALIRSVKEELLQYAKLRNAIVHEKYYPGQYIAEPHLHVVQRIERVCEELEQPKLALTVASKPVVYFYEQDDVQDVLQAISRYGFSQFPIYKTNGQCVGLVTEGGILKYIHKHMDKGKFDFSGVKTSHILPFEKEHIIVYVSAETDIYEIEEIYSDYQEKGRKLESIIITQNGNQNEKPLGMITSWDLTKITRLNNSIR
ncbi:putative transcriptional regulator [Anoxybacillus vitaminiphilus]|uniref:Putative transcriptional regulator n=1 Tax=Paranoxybacillus vitaminiphilus TaxID=581036 RepID=A0A327YQ07_9BACL|nr:CBS domain-containing protein [Anoxybacillus vitaminiphilus]RAK23063.1 putative transcriptional regulator [Anoxybacillus vitaminiphilus]